MKTIKKLGLVSAVAFAMFALSACDDSSSASSDETSVSSSSVETSDLDESSSSVDKNSSGNESTEKDKSSSSVKGSEPAEVSSSSAKETKNSSDSKSSSSVKTDDSSSSNKDVSSSSVSSSSSENQSSSSSVKQSSSSSNDVQSSSSKQNPWGTDAEWWPFSCNAHGGCLEFTDKRNGRTYKYLKFDGKDTSGKNATIYAMVENLNVGEMVRGFKDQKDDSKIERYCYDNDTLNCHYYGGLCQWAEMMNLPFECNSKSCADSIKPNHQGICPDGWRLLTYNDFYIIVNSNGNQDGVKGTRSTFGFGGSNDTGYSLVGAGYNWQHTFTRMNESTYWHYPQEGTLGDNTSFVGCQSRTETTLCSQSTYKTNGFSVRCVIVNQK
ncbi:major paralogous domain-containing protein [Fibrobacter intestinalis]|uniref:Major paralogous domain-containing protein n=1 Tax=Fibrobacter intestinalis TaxID=28122 RepID=A0A1M6Y2K5_9BACT|nr:FISUMP domain-containing protein [Fibrobacter intestinalis]SHL12481.1 major paralogous domain-containing protein [Fibrobacter intestinalis]